MCWVQEIHEVFCPDLVFDVAGQEHHVCERAYPAPAPGEPDVRCPLHSCCRVTTELVSECAAVREARAASEGQGEGKEGEREDFSCGDQENSAYREIVFIAIDERNGKGPVVWENTADRSRGQALMGPWEVLWDAADDEGYACESGPASRKGSSATNTKVREGIAVPDFLVVMTTTTATTMTATMRIKRPTSLSRVRTWNSGHSGPPMTPVATEAAAKAYTPTSQRRGVSAVKCSCTSRTQSTYVNYRPPATGCLESGATPQPLKRRNKVVESANVKAGLALARKTGAMGAVVAGGGRKRPR